jgi:hypothetical protein
VTMQTLADRTSTFQFAYTVGSGKVTQTTITDPNGNVEQKSFDSNGFVTTDILAKGSSVQQTFTFTRDPIPNWSPRRPTHWGGISAMATTRAAISRVLLVQIA